MRTSTFKKTAGMILGAMLMTTVLFAQEDPAKRPSPPAVDSAKVHGTTLVIHYSSPSVKGRAIWGGLVPYGQVWRAGANEATTFETDKDIKVEGQTLTAGKYALFAIPTENKWTIIFNKVAQQWGAYKYDSTQDALRVTVTPKKAGKMYEKLVYKIDKKGFVLDWENLEVPVSIK